MITTPSSAAQAIDGIQFPVWCPDTVQHGHSLVDMSGVGVTKPMYCVPLIFLIFHLRQNTGYLLNITFIFDVCHRSSAAVTHVKYESDEKNLIYIFCKIKNVFSEEIYKRSFSNPHPRSSLGQGSLRPYMD